MILTLKIKIFSGFLIVSVCAVLAWYWLTPGGLDVAPNIEFKLIDGRNIKLKELQGQPVLVTFWATTCKGCLKEMPHLITLYNELEQQGLEIVGVAMSYDPPNRVLELTKRKQIPYPVALDIDGNAANAFGNVTITPTSFLIAPDGNIVKFKIGEMDIKKIREDILSMIVSAEEITSPKSS